MFTDLNEKSYSCKQSLRKILQNTGPRTSSTLGILQSEKYEKLDSVSDLQGDMS